MKPAFMNLEKVKQMANIVLSKPLKVHSKAIDEMGEEMKRLLIDL